MEQLLLQQIREELNRANMLKCLELHIKLLDSGISKPGYEKQYNNMLNAVDSIMQQL